MSGRLEVRERQPVPRLRAGRPLDPLRGACYSSRVPSASPYDSIEPGDIERGRVLASVAYLPGLCFLGLLGAPDNAFVGFHARQGFLLLLVEIVIGLFLAIYDGSLGRIPFLGPFVGYVIKFALWTSMLFLTVFGVVKAANGEIARIPYLGDHVERIPF
jgi:uncharacterized membrane protein